MPIWSMRAGKPRIESGIQRAPERGYELDGGLVRHGAIGLSDPKVIHPIRPALNLMSYYLAEHAPGPIASHSVAVLAGSGKSEKWGGGRQLKVADFETSTRPEPALLVEARELFTPLQGIPAIQAPICA
jgi:hypothetical protein